LKYCTRTRRARLNVDRATTHKRTATGARAQPHPRPQLCGRPRQLLDLEFSSCRRGVGGVVGLAGALCRSPREVQPSAAALGMPPKGGTKYLTSVPLPAAQPPQPHLPLQHTHTQRETALFVTDASSRDTATTADLRARLLSLPRFPLTASRMQLGSSSSIEPTLAGAAEVEDSDVPYATAVDPPGVLPQQWNEWIH